MADPRLQETKMYLIFISHAGPDTWVAKRISHCIREKGADTFLDEAQVAVGDDFEDRILEALDRADELLVYFTPWSLKRPYVWTEIGAAWGKRLPITGVLHGIRPEELSAQSGIPIFIKQRNLIEINDLDRYLSQLPDKITRDGRQI